LLNNSDLQSNEIFIKKFFEKVLNYKPSIGKMGDNIKRWRSWKSYRKNWKGHTSKISKGSTLY